MAKKRVPNNEVATSREAVDALQRRLRRRRVEFIKKPITGLRAMDMLEQPVVVVTYRGTTGFCLVRQSHVGKLLGNEPLRSLKMKFSGFVAVGYSVPAILNCGAFDALTLTYFDEEPAVAVAPAMVLQHIK